MPIKDGIHYHESPLYEPADSPQDNLEAMMPDKPEVTEEHRQAAREVAHSLQSRCSGGTGYGVGGDGPRYHSASCDTATTAIALALAEAEEDAASNENARMAKVVDALDARIAQLRSDMKDVSEMSNKDQARIAQLEADLKQVTEERDELKQTICHLNNRARHDWAQAVEDATDKLFKEMNANVVRKQTRAKAS